MTAQWSEDSGGNTEAHKLQSITIKYKMFMTVEKEVSKLSSNLKAKF